MKTWKKVLACFLVLLMVLSLAGCQLKKEEETPATSEASQETAKEESKAEVKIQILTER